jgi:hypothetical protein
MPDVGIGDAIGHADGNGALWACTRERILEPWLEKRKEAPGKTGNPGARLLWKRHDDDENHPHRLAI